jgi:hypothetical protein
MIRLNRHGIAAPMPLALFVSGMASPAMAQRSPASAIRAADLARTAVRTAAFLRRNAPSATVLSLQPHVTYHLMKP